MSAKDPNDYSDTQLLSGLVLTIRQRRDYVLAVRVLASVMPRSRREEIARGLFAILTDDEFDQLTSALDTTPGGQVMGG